MTHGAYIRHKEFDISEGDSFLCEDTALVGRAVGHTELTFMCRLFEARKHFLFSFFFFFLFFFFHFSLFLFLVSFCFFSFPFLFHTL